jgi:predicted N-acetyltransferase YhbS
MEIRPLQDSDHEQASLLFYEVFGPQGCGEEWSIETSREFIKENTWNKDYTFCAEKDGKVVGLIIAFPSIREKGPGLYIHVIAVKNTEQGHGIGKALWEKVTGLAKENNLKSLHLHGNPKYPSFNWYKSMGFTQTGYIELAKPLDK